MSAHQDKSQDLSLDELSELIASVDPDGSVASDDIVKMYLGLMEESAADADDDDGEAQMDLAAFLHICHTHAIGRKIGSLAQQRTEEQYE